MNLLFIASLFITLLFFLSGFNKIKDFNQVTKGFVNKTKIPLFLAKIVISIYKIIAYRINHIHYSRDFNLSLSTSWV